MGAKQVDVMKIESTMVVTRGREGCMGCRAGGWMNGSWLMGTNIKSEVISVMFDRLVWCL